MFKKSGRRLELTEEGRTALRYAEQIFMLGTELESALQDTRGDRRTLDFRVGIADSVPKAIAYRLLEPGLAVPAQVRLICHEGTFEDLLAQISVNRLDLVIADEAMGKQIRVNAFNHALGTTAMSFFAAPGVKRSLKGGFPKCLDGAPMLIQGASSAMRQRLDVWLTEQGLRPRLIGEFDDAALMDDLIDVNFRRLFDRKCDCTSDRVRGNGRLLVEVADCVSTCLV